MIIDFYNKDVAHAQFKICWGIEHCTPVFTLEKGAIGSYHLSYSHDIRPGTQCFVYAWNSSTNNFNLGITFIYEKGTKTETFSYFMNTLTKEANLELVEDIF